MDAWCMDGSILKDKFPRLFALETNKSCVVNDRWGVSNGVWSGTWSWSVPPRARNVKALSSMIQVDCNLGKHRVWNSWVPRKINVCIWRAYLDRLPTRVNLANKGLVLPSKACPLCDLEDETINDCLFSFSKVKTIWRKVWSWWRIDMISSLASLSIRDVSCGNVGNVSISGIPKLSKILHGVYQVVGRCEDAHTVTYMDFADALSTSSLMKSPT
ncbi:RNA-directed DNA polymerase, eukaryota, reverse transcriptase zinc-binding domain protein [Tanacetum coccineum]